MLEVKNLYKDYRSKTGVVVHALNGVSIKFRKTGLVFIVGKSGCGKSTLLNVLGGLDKPDGGEIIINGTSSLKFKPSDFDSYRNTYVGFVFQEYNLLKDFSVGANVALALELQSKRATTESVNDILKTVDLDGYGTRRINELSGGQKQRVAIARALVKDPEIILADEPSGALDSANAKQLFDTLKKLSETKLVIVVSHDREFAFSYGDRVIEMSDGRIIADVERSSETVSAENSTGENGAKAIETTDGATESGENTSGLKFDNGEIFVPEKYVLTYVDLRAINEYLAKHGAAKIKKVEKKAAMKGEFKPFDEKTVEAETEEFKPIKSTLPVKNAFKMGASNLGIKKFRLVLTIILSVISFTMFGLYDVLISFNEREATINSICDNGIKFASFQKIEKYYYDENDKSDYYETRAELSEADLEKIEKDVGIKMTGVYSNTACGFQEYVAEVTKLGGKSYYNVYRTMLSGYVELNGEPKDYGLTLIGSSRLPETFDEMMLPEFIVKSFMRGGFKGDDGETVAIAKPEDMIGKKITFSSETPYYDVKMTETFTICGVFSTGTVFKKYEALLDVDTDNMETAEQVKNMLVSSELSDLLSYSFNGVGVVKKGYVDNISNKDVYYGYEGKLIYEAGNIPEGVKFIDFYNNMAIVRRASALKNVSFIDEGKTSLNDDEILLSEASFANLKKTLDSLGKTDMKAKLRLYDDRSNDYKDFTVAGSFTDEDSEESAAFSDATFESLISAPYYVCFGSFDGSRLNVIKLVDYSFKRDGDYYYRLVNHVTDDISIVTALSVVLKPVFMWVGIVNAIFAALLLSNFIAIGVMNKKTEIGILRAIGARGVDVFKVFFSESGIIATINFVLSSIVTAVVCFIINKNTASSWSIYATIMNFGIRQIFILLLISFAVAAIASFLPIYKLAKKKPVDVILNK